MLVAHTWSNYTETRTTRCFKKKEKTKKMKKWKTIA